MISFIVSFSYFSPKILHSKMKCFQEHPVYPEKMENPESEVLLECQEYPEYLGVVNLFISTRDPFTYYVTAEQSTTDEYNLFI